MENQAKTNVIKMEHQSKKDDINPVAIEISVSEESEKEE